uniref:Protein MRP-126-like n=2 Tax=Strigops habroptila TaxID=2489341 RepID=A0A672UY37_STRHB
MSPGRGSPWHSQATEEAPGHQTSHSVSLQRSLQCHQLFCRALLHQCLSYRRHFLRGGGNGISARICSCTSQSRSSKVCSSLQSPLACREERIQTKQLKFITKTEGLNKTRLCPHLTSQTQEPLSQLEKAMDVIIDVFHQYSRREGDRDTLTKTELKLLIEKQLANYLKHVKSKATIDEIMKDLDMNKDAQLSFCEVMLLITRVTIATHEHLHDVENQQQQQHKHQQQHHH